MGAGFHRGPSGIPLKRGNRKKRKVYPQPRQEPPRIMWDPLTGYIDSDYQRTEPPAESFEWNQPEPEPAPAPDSEIKPEEVRPWSGLPEKQQTNPNKMWDDPPDFGSALDQLGNMFGGAVDWINETFPGELPSQPASPLGAGGPPPAEKGQGTPSPPTDTGPSYSPFPGARGPRMESDPIKSDQEKAIEKEAGVEVPAPKEPLTGNLGHDPNREFAPPTLEEVVEEQQAPQEQTSWPGDWARPEDTNAGSIYEQWERQKNEESGPPPAEAPVAPREQPSWPGDQEQEGPVEGGELYETWKEQDAQRQSNIDFTQNYLDSRSLGKRIRRIQKYDTNGDNVLDDNELLAMYKDMNEFAVGKGYDSAQDMYQQAQEKIRQREQWKQERAAEIPKVMEDHNLTKDQLAQLRVSGREFYRMLSPEEKALMKQKYDRNGDGKFGEQDLIDFLYNELMTNVERSADNPEIDALRRRVGREYGIDYFNEHPADSGYQQPQADAPAQQAAPPAAAPAAPVGQRGEPIVQPRPDAKLKIDFNRHITHNQNARDGKGSYHLTDEWLEDNGITDTREGLAARRHFNNEMRKRMDQHGITTSMLHNDKERARIEAKVNSWAMEIANGILTDGTHSELHNRVYNQPRTPAPQGRPGDDQVGKYIPGRVGGGTSITGHKYPSQSQEWYDQWPSRQRGGSQESQSRPVYQSRRGSTPGRAGGGQQYEDGELLNEFLQEPRYDDGGVDVSRLPPGHPLRIRHDGPGPGKFEGDPVDAPGPYGPKGSNSGEKKAAARDARDKAYQDYIWQGYSEAEARAHASQVYKEALRWQYSGRQ